MTSSGDCYCKIKLVDIIPNAALESCKLISKQKYNENIFPFVVGDSGNDSKYMKNRKGNNRKTKKRLSLLSLK